MYLKLLIVLVFTANIFGSELQRNYFIEGDQIKISDILKDQPIKEDGVLFTFSSTHYIKRVKSKELLKLLAAHGYTKVNSKYPYIQFSKKSPIDTKSLKEYIISLYRSKYKQISIKSVKISPRTYMEKLPAYTDVEFPQNEYLGNTGILSIKTKEHKQIFFNYEIDASVDVYIAKKDLQRNDELSVLNTTKNSIILKNFRSMPIQKLDENSLQVKHDMQKGELLTQRDVDPLSLIRRGSSVNVVLKNGSIFISFSAKALQDGILGESIFVENEKGKKIKVQVTGKNRATVK
ncbi:MAG: flagellar basal body P-ring formation protein FlgA [Campylobacterales bacterium]|nr:flagellar basal body P-ring formation protein FlgA [Campylobacterales bacterium]